MSAALDELVVEELLFRFDPEAEDLLGDEVEFTGIASAVSVDPERAVIALRSVFLLEQDLAKTIRSLADRPAANCEIDPRYGDVLYCERVIAKVAAQTSFKLDEDEVFTPGRDQVKALQMALNAPFHFDRRAGNR